MSDTSNPYLAHLNNTDNRGYRNYNNNSFHRIHLNVRGKPNNNSSSLKTKSASFSNKSFNPYFNNSFSKLPTDSKLIKSNKFIYGNYEHYYGYRNKSAIPIDPRIELFEEEWFKNKKCLDVGCNSGFLTVSIAMLFEPKLIEGVDIDPHLIKKAQNYLIFRNSLSKHQNIENDTLLFDYYPISCPLTIGSIPIILNNNLNLENDKKINSKKMKKIEIHNKLKMDVDSKNDNKKQEFNKNIIENENEVEKDTTKKFIEENNEIQDSTQLSINECQFPNNVYFRVSDWINEPTIEEQKNSYDIILGLSITKWIHLNWCDYGIKRFFNKVYETLNDNGIFILEPQPFSGYSKKAKNNKKLLSNIKSIQLYPEHFHQYLMETVGFKSYELLGKSTNQSKGFQRNIYIYRK